MQRLGGEQANLPFRTSAIQDAGSCVEFRALETGADIQLTLEVEGSQLVGSDGGVSRYGLQSLVHCSASTQPYTLSIKSTDSHGGATALFSTRTWTASPTLTLAPFQTLSVAFVEVNHASTVRGSGKRFAESAAQFDAAGDSEHAAIAWMIATRRAEVALDHPLAETTFRAALEHTRALGWTRDEVVLLNDRALFIAAEDTPLAQQLAGESFAAQRKLGDPLLAAAIENNVCLLSHQFGDLNLAESCFARLLAKDEALGMRSSTVGAVRNNWALVQMSKGQYSRAAAAFRRAAAERLAGADNNGYVISTGNLALCLYQSGSLASALGELHGAYKFARDHDDDIGRAKIAEYLASVYLAWGDSDTAKVFAAEAEDVYRNNKRAADLAPALRLRARIEADRGNPDIALRVVGEAWTLAVDNKLMRAAANIAGTYADILLDRGDLVAAGKFIREANDRFGQRYEAHDRLKLRAAELRWLRLSGNHREASDLATRLLAQAPYPGLLRTTVLIERYLLRLSVTDTAKAVDLYEGLLDEIRRSVALAPDPELAFRLLEIVRPAAEAAISTTLVRCKQSPNCANDTLTLALEYFELEPELRGRPIQAETGELTGLLQSLSALQARDDLSAAPNQLEARIKQLQSAARMQAVIGPKSGCEACEQIRHDDTNVVYFFGSEKGWRWQRNGPTWEINELPKWSVLASNLRSLERMETWREGLSALSPLVTDLPNYQSRELVVSGDTRISQVPMSALRLGDGAVIDRYAVSIKIGHGRKPPSIMAVAAFLGNEGSGDTVLPMVDAERKIVRNWTERVGISMAGDQTGSQALTLLHISAHGQRDVGSGSPVLWLGAHPLLSYMIGDQPVADTIVINACESGAVPDFGLSQSSIASGFLHAGARQVVATLFPIGDVAAARFSEKFYASYDPAKHNLANAVQDAQLALRDSRSNGLAWAAYVVLTSRD